MKLDQVAVDGDDLNEVLEELVTSWRLQLDDQAFAKAECLGDIHAVFATASAFDRGDDRCATAMVYFRLRRLILDGGRVPPSTPLRELGLGSPRRLRTLLKTDGWQTPPLLLSAIGCAGLSIGVVSMALAWSLSSAWLVIASVITPIVALRYDLGTFSGAWMSVGSLATHLARLNRARLAGEGARTGADQLWNDVRDGIANMTNTPAELIDRDTRLRIT